jgi:hypothetical protein
MKRHRSVADTDTLRRRDLRLVVGLSLLLPLASLAALGPAAANLPF